MTGIPDDVIEAMKGAMVEIDRRQGWRYTDLFTAMLHAALRAAEAKGWTLQNDAPDPWKTRR